MRLTVRTLLAWIDGVLAPEDQQALGEKVAASGVAPALIERTKAVVGHQGLSAPSPVGRGLADGVIELKDRRSGDRRDIALADAVGEIGALLAVLP